MCEVHFRLYYYDLASVVAKWNAAFARSCSAGQVKHYLAEGVVGGGSENVFKCSLCRCLSQGSTCYCIYSEVFYNIIVIICSE